MKQNARLIQVKINGYSYIYAYYKHQGNVIKVNTYTNYIEGKMTKSLLYTSNVDNYEEINRKTINLVNRVNDYIMTKYLAGVNSFTVNQRECLAYISDNNYYTVNKIEHRKGNAIGNNNTNKTLNTYLSEFIATKENSLTGSTLSLYYYMQRYLNEFNGKIDLSEVNQTFTTNFINHLLGRGMTNNGVNTYIRKYKALLNNLQRENIYQFSFQTLNPQLKKTTKEVMSLTKEELQAIITLAQSNPKPSEEKTLKCFIFQCLTGLRISDLSDLNQTNFKLINGQTYLVKKTQKTQTSVTIPLHPLAISIIEEYNYKLPLPTGKGYNLNLKAIFKRHNLLTEQTEVMQLQGNKSTKQLVSKYELVSSHWARKTFITLNLNNGLPVNQLMQLTGHKNVSTLQKYMSKSVPTNILSNI